MSLFKILSDEQAKMPFFQSEEANFYYRYSYMLSDVESYSYLLKADETFNIIRANIILRAMLNKIEIEKKYQDHLKTLEKDKGATPMKEFMSTVLSSMPYLEWNGEKIFVPIFASSLAKIYTEDHEKLVRDPYKKLLKDYETSVIDPFDYYGNALYDSYFTRLVIIKRHENIMAAYDYDAESIYFINDEGRLDVKVSLFDKGLETPIKNHMIPRLQKVVDAYFSNDKDAFIESLVNEKFISSSLAKRIREGER